MKKIFVVILCVITAFVACTNKTANSTNEADTSYEDSQVGQSAAPLFSDRIDVQVEIQPVPFKKLSEAAPGESSADIRKRVVAARDIQSERFKSVNGVHCNAQMSDKMIHEYAEPDENGLKMLRLAMEKRSLSARAYGRILKVARTIADLAGSPQVTAEHIGEAIGYRNLDRSDWAEG